MSKRVAILISGRGSNMEMLLEHMRRHHDVAHPVLVLSNNPDAFGLKVAGIFGVPTEVLDHRAFKGDRDAFDAALADRLNAAAPDITCLAGFMRVLGPEFFARFKGEVLNIHPSLLPKYKGLDTHARALAAGETEHGCTVHRVTPDLDGGPILAQERVPVEPGDDARSLAIRVRFAEHRLYWQVLECVAEGRPVPPQGERPISICG